MSYGKIVELNKSLSKSSSIGKYSSIFVGNGRLIKNIKTAIFNVLEYSKISFSPYTLLFYAIYFRNVSSVIQSASCKIYRLN